MKRTLAPEERAVWQRATEDVRRRGHAKAAGPPAASAAAPPNGIAPARPAAPARAAVGLDHRSAQRLRRGEMAIEARLDLHGLTQAEAHRALLRFIERAYGDSRRAVLVITGKGDGGGVLRAGVPRWLCEAPVRGLILATSEAQPRHGGAGARYVLLRKRR